MQCHKEIVASKAVLKTTSHIYTQSQKVVLGKEPSSFNKALCLIVLVAEVGSDFSFSLDICMLGIQSLFQLVMVSPTSEQYDSLLRQMSERIDEGCGETIYVIGQGSGQYSFLWITRENMKMITSVTAVEDDTSP